MTEPLAAPASAPDLDIRPVGAAELPFVLSSWCQSNMRSPGQPWGELYAKYIKPTITELLSRDDVWILGAFGPYESRQDALLAWIAWTPGELPAVHYAFTRGHLRKRGYFTALLDKAMVGRRFIYTFKGALPKFRRRKSPTYDKRVVDALTRRGVATAYVSADRWLERMR